MKSRNLSDHLDLNFFLKKSESNIYFNHKINIILEIFEKRNTIWCAILDMKVSNTDTIDTVTDEKNLTGACFKVGASKNLSVLS